MAAYQKPSQHLLCGNLKTKLCGYKQNELFMYGVLSMLLQINSSLYLLVSLRVYYLFVCLICGYVTDF